MGGVHLINAADSLIAFGSSLAADALPVRPHMTQRRFWWWSGFWVVGWALWLFGPRDTRWLGWTIAFGVAPWFAITRDQFGQKVTKAQIIGLLVLLVVLAAAIALPLWFHVNWPIESRSARFACAITVVLGLVVNARRTFRVDRREA